jgi:hypothetical protein
MGNAVFPRGDPGVIQGTYELGGVQVTLKKYAEGESTLNQVCGGV